jgi:predicted RecA/RadA family phage recombinase
MANNFKFSGKRLQLEAAADVASGVLVRNKGYLGIPMVNCAAGASVTFALEGVWGMTYAGYGSVQPAIGSILYWDTSAGALSIGRANDDYTAVKCVTAVSATNGSFNGLLLPQGAPIGQDQS